MRIYGKQAPLAKAIVSDKDILDALTTDQLCALFSATGTLDYEAASYMAKYYPAYASTAADWIYFDIGSGGIYQPENEDELIRLIADYAESSPPECPDDPSCEDVILWELAVNSWAVRESENLNSIVDVIQDDAFAGYIVVLDG